VPLETYARLQSSDAVPRAVLRRMVQGVSTRDYVGVVELARDSKALQAATRRVWGNNAVIRRCQVHKRRNIKAYRAEEHHAELDRQLVAAYQKEDHKEAKRSLETTAKWLSRLNPDAAANPREGLEETLMVLRLSLTGSLRRTLCSTDPIESALSVTQRVTSRVTRWCDGEIWQGWCVAWLARAESKFRRVKGHGAMKALLKALRRLVRGAPSGNERDVA
jgi:transposase-like protein